MEQLKKKHGQNFVHLAFEQAHEIRELKKSTGISTPLQVVIVRGPRDVDKTAMVEEYARKMYMQPPYYVPFGKDKLAEHLVRHKVAVLNDWEMYSMRWKILLQLVEGKIPEFSLVEVIFIVTAEKECNILHDNRAGYDAARKFLDCVTHEQYCFDKTPEACLEEIIRTIASK